MPSLMLTLRWLLRCPRYFFAAADAATMPSIDFRFIFAIADVFAAAMPLITLMLFAAARLLHHMPYRH